MMLNVKIVVDSLAVENRADNLCQDTGSNPVKLLFLNIVMNFGGFLHSELVMRIKGDLVVHKPTTAIVYNATTKHSYFNG